MPKSGGFVAAAQQDIVNFHAIYELYRERVFRYIRFHVPTKEVAEDLTSESFIKAISAFSRFNGREAECASWLYTIAGNTIADWYRKKQEVPLDEKIENPAGEQCVEKINNKIDARIEQDQLLFCINQLAEKERLVLILKTFEELTFQQIANLLQKKESAIKMLYYRSLTKLKSVAQKRFRSQL